MQDWLKLSTSCQIENRKEFDRWNFIAIEVNDDDEGKLQ